MTGPAPTRLARDAGDADDPPGAAPDGGGGDTQQLDFPELLEVLGYRADERIAVGHAPLRERPHWTVTSADEAPAEAAQHRHLNCWFTPNPVAGVQPGKRGTEDQVTRWATWGVDFDLGKSDGGMPSKAAIRDAIAELSRLLNTEPVTIIHSGSGGMQALWGLDPDDPATDLTEPGNRRVAKALVTRLGRLAQQVAARHGGAVDSVWDLTRVWRAPGTTHQKLADAPTRPVTAELAGGGEVIDADEDDKPIRADRLTVEYLIDVLDGAGIQAYAEDGETRGEVVSDPEGWGWAAAGSCSYSVQSMIARWPNDRPGDRGRHPSLLGKAVRLAAAHRRGCLTELDYRRGKRVLEDLMASWCKTVTPTREVAPGEVDECITWGRAEVARMTDERVAKELGDHEHGDDLDGIFGDAATADEDEVAVDPHTGEVLDKATRTPLQQLGDQLRLWVDGDLDQFTFGAAVAVTAADTDGEALWGQIVGPPSGAKTEAIRTVDDIATDTVDEVTVPGLLGWQKVGRTARMTGALARIGDNPVAGLLTIGDFSTVLGSDKRSGTTTEAVFSALRRIYDGRYTRDVGTAPEQLRWQGRLTVLSAVTHAIDDFAAHADALGGRWVYFRVRDVPINRRRHSRQRAAGTLPKRRRRAAHLAATAVRAARRRLPDVDLSDRLYDVTDDAAELAARGRGSVPRDTFGKRDIVAEPVVEEPYRLRQQLQQLARGLLALQMAEDDVARFVIRCALDTMPRTRRKVLAVLADGGEHSVRNVAELAGRIDRKVTRRVLEDLRALGLACCPTADAEDDDAESAPLLPKDWQLAKGQLGELAGRVIAAETPAGGVP